MPSKGKKTTKAAQSGPVLKSATTSITDSIRTNQLQAQPLSPPPNLDDLVPSEFDIDGRTGDTTESAGEPTPVPAVNRKKQKRREREAARRVADQQKYLPNGHVETSTMQNGRIEPVKQGRGPVKGYFTEETDYIDPDFEDNEQDQGLDAEDEFFSNDEDGEYSQTYLEGPDHSWLNTSKRKKTSKKRTRPNPMPHTSSNTLKPFPTLSNAALRSAHKMSNANDHIWNTSTQAERENIKQFWLKLGEDERRSLVRVEKEAVLRKMKEQQKHSCSCSVCGRKRTAIEEELEVLYDAYYSELEQYAHRGDPGSDSPRSMPPPRTPLPYRRSHHMAGAYPVQGRIHELGDDGEELDDEDDYDDEEDEEAYSDEEDFDDQLPPGPADFFQFGNSLTVKDGILTVADDLLKNDGKHFIDMMEQLAERRMQREEEIHYPSQPLAHHSVRQGHNHPPIDEDDDYDDEDDDEDYDSQEEDDFEGDEMDAMTEGQRMEEGRRMFQIFAARMFEQRVLTAYKEKVAAERQRKLLEELEADNEKDAQREAKKAKDAAKKKEKKARQKAQQAEDKAKKDAEKAAQEAAARDAEEQKLAEKRAKQEEQRRKREAERRAAEEERIRKEAEKVQRAQKERERQQEIEKKAKEAREREKRQREEQKKREREEKELIENEARERRLKEEREKKEHEAHQRRQREAAVKAEKEAKERAKAEQAPRHQSIALPPGLHPPPRTAQVQSPNLTVATPTVAQILPAASRSRQASQPSQLSQQSHSSSPQSQKASTEPSQTSASPANAGPAQVPIPNQSMKNSRPGPPLHHPQPSAPRSPLSNMGMNNMGRGTPHYSQNYGNMHGMGINGLQSVGTNHMSMGGPMHMYPPGPPPMGGQRFPPNGMHYPPGFNGARPFQPSQHLPFQQPPPGVGPMVTPQPTPAQQTHSRQPSGSETTPQPAPIARPGPIARPSSTTPDKQRAPSKTEDVEKITTQLGSSALLDDSDEPFAGQLDGRPHQIPLGAPGTGRIPFANTFASDKPAAFGMGSSNWGAFNPPSSTGPFGQSVPHIRPGGWPQPIFDPMGPQPGLGRPYIPRPISVRLMLVQACRHLSAVSAGKGDGYHPAREVLRQVEQLQPPSEPPVSMDEILGICDTEGNVQNGGGTFEVMVDNSRGQIIKFVEDTPGKIGGGMRNGLGDIGSPLPGHQVSSFGSIGSGVQHHAHGHGPPGPHHHMGPNQNLAFNTQPKPIGRNF